MKNAALIVLCTVVLLGLSVLIMFVSANNTEVGLRADFEAQQKSNESSFDKLWKVIQEQASVAESERESFRKTFTEIMTAQQGVAGKGALASFFTQAKVDVSSELFSKLMSSIEAQRESFHRDQQKLLQLKAQHDKILRQLPSSLFLAGRPRLEAKIVTSTRTTATFETGKDDQTLHLQK